MVQLHLHCEYLLGIESHELRKTRMCKNTNSWGDKRFLHNIVFFLNHINLSMQGYIYMITKRDSIDISRILKATVTHNKLKP